MALFLVTGPTVEPVTLDDIKDFCGVIDDADDMTLQSLVASARQRVERTTGRQLITATYDDKREELCGDEIAFARPPLQSVTSVTYVDLNGATQTWSSSNYQVEAPTGPTAARGELSPAYGVWWPPIRQYTVGAFVVRFKAGYGDTPDDVPADLRQAIKLMVKGWFDHDPALVALGHSLTLPYKVFA